jgi:hypothetical protein
MIHHIAVGTWSNRCPDASVRGRSNILSIYAQISPLIIIVDIKVKLGFCLNSALTANIKSAKHPFILQIL